MPAVTVLPTLTIPPEVTSSDNTNNSISVGETVRGDVGGDEEGAVGGAIGGAVGGTITLILVVVLCITIWYMRHSCKKKKAYKHDHLVYYKTGSDVTFYPNLCGDTASEAIRSTGTIVYNNYNVLPNSATNASKSSMYVCVFTCIFIPLKLCLKEFTVQYLSYCLRYCTLIIITSAVSFEVLTS